VNKLITLNEEDTIEAGAYFSASLLQKETHRSLVLFLHGDLGAGKTTFTKGILRGLNYEGLVKSPTYNLVEIHKTKALMVYHFDLYRIKDHHELEEIGIREYLEEPDSLCIFEWPDNAGSLMPSADFEITLLHDDGPEPDSRLITFA
jgi:tRNA threonylcarbamoyladenosine biosynthesis protein TsaE